MQTKNDTPKTADSEQQSGKGFPEATCSPREEFQQAIGLAGLPNAVHPLLDCDSDYIEWLEKELLEARRDAEWARDLMEHWERRCAALDKLVEDARKTASEETIARLQGKASMARSMTVELKREIRSANAQGGSHQTGANDE